MDDSTPPRGGLSSPPAEYLNARRARERAGGVPRRVVSSEEPHENKRRRRGAGGDQARDKAAKGQGSHPERSRQHRHDAARRAAVAKRKTEARRARGRRWYREHRDQERKRARRFRAEHPERVRQYQRDYAVRHPDRAAQNARAATQRWRDRNADHARVAQAESARKRRQSDPDVNRRYYAANLEAERERSRAAARLRRRLVQLGLPARRIHRVFAEQKRANASAADAFFTRRRTKPQIHDLQLEKDPIPYARLLRQEARQRALRPHGAENKGLRAEATALIEQQILTKLLPDFVRSYVVRNRDRIREEIRLDSVARRIAGKSEYDVAAELATRIRVEVFAAAAAELAPDGSPEGRARLHQAMFPRYTAARAQALATADDGRAREAMRLLALASERSTARPGR